MIYHEIHEKGLVYIKRSVFEAVDRYQDVSTM